MSPVEKAMFEALGKASGVKSTPSTWARIAWPTLFVCKRSGKDKAPQSVKNAENKAVTILEAMAEKGMVQREWAPNPCGYGQRKVYWREDGTVK